MILPKHDDERDEGLDAARHRLSEERGRPFEVDKVLAAHRVREEKEQAARRAAEAKLEETVRAARERRHQVYEQSLARKETDAVHLELEAEKRRKTSAVKPREKHADGKEDKKSRDGAA